MHIIVRRVILQYDSFLDHFKSINYDSSISKFDVKPKTLIIVISIFELQTFEHHKNYNQFVDLIKRACNNGTCNSMLLQLSG